MVSGTETKTEDRTGAAQTNADIHGEPFDVSVANGPLEDRRDQPAVNLPRFALVGLFVIALFFTLYYARSFILPVVLAILISFPLNPPVQLLRKCGLPIWSAALLILLAFLGLFTYGCAELTAPAQKWLSDVPTMVSNVGEKLSDVRASVQTINEAKEQVEEAISEAGEEDPEREPSDARNPLVVPPRELDAAESKPVKVQIEAPPLPAVMNLAGLTGDLLGQALVTIVLTYFLLASGDQFLRKTVEIFPQFRDKRKVVTIARAISLGASSYFFNISIVNACLGIAIGLAMWVLGVPNPILWGVMAAMLNFLPYLGALIGTGIVTLVALANFDSLGSAMLVPVAYATCTMIEGQFVTPNLLGKHFSINPVVILLSLLFWGWLWGVPGAICAVPMLTGFKILCDQTESLRPIGIFIEN